MNAQAAFAVVDTETTGLLTGFHHRIAEVAIVHVDPKGVVTDEWSTLVNPQRDLGPQEIHGIRAADVRRAPTFEQIAGEVVERLRGRIVVAHNWRFDARHLRAEFARLGIDAPLHDDAGLCTMRTAGAAKLGSSRSLVECCAAAGLPEVDWHTARDDAVAPVHRRPVSEVEPHFLARLVERMPREDDPAVDDYLAMLDAALLDRQISESEADALLELAYELGLHRFDAVQAHHAYLRALVTAAWEDGVVTQGERKDIHTVATLLGLSAETADQLLTDAQTSTAAEPPACPVTPGGLVLRSGDTVVLTGEMEHGRREITERATAAGLRVSGSVSRKTRVLAAADPDSLSGKAGKARQLGVPIVGEHALMRALLALSSVGENA